MSIKSLKSLIFECNKAVKFSKMLLHSDKGFQGKSKSKIKTSIQFDWTFKKWFLILTMISEPLANNNKPIWKAAKKPTTSSMKKIWKISKISNIFKKYSKSIDNFIKMKPANWRSMNKQSNVMQMKLKSFNKVKSWRKNSMNTLRT